MIRHLRCVFVWACIHQLISYSYKQFIPKLKDHVLRCLWAQDSDGPAEFSSDDRNNIVICNSILFSVNTLRVNYTSYDLQCEQDLINPHNHADIMLLSGDSRSCSTHPYWYARVRHIFHVNVLDLWLGGANAQKTQLEILFVRWFDPVQCHRSGIKAARLPKVAFVPEIDDSVFGFVDPASVVRGVHLIPAFADGRVQSTLQQKSAGCIRREDDEWTSYYVNM